MPVVDQAANQNKNPPLETNNTTQQAHLQQQENSVQEKGKIDSPDEWIEQHARSSTLVRELLKKFQNKTSKDQPPSTRCKSLLVSSSTSPTFPPYKQTFAADFSTSYELNTVDKEVVPSVSSLRPTDKTSLNTKNLAHSTMLEESNKAVDSHLSSNYRLSVPATMCIEKSDILPRKTHLKKLVSLEEEPVTGEVPVSKLKTLFDEQSKLSKRDNKTIPKNITPPADFIAPVDYLSVLRPCKAAEWNRDIIEKPSPRSQSCVLSNDYAGKKYLATKSKLKHVNAELPNQFLQNDKIPEKSIPDLNSNEPTKLKTSSAPASFKGLNSSSDCDSKISKPSLSSTTIEPSKSKQSSSFNTESKVKSILKKKEVKVSENYGKEIVLKNDDINGNVLDQVPYFKSVLKPTQNSDVILYEDSLSSPPSGSIISPFSKELDFSMTSSTVNNNFIHSKNMTNILSDSRQISTSSNQQKIEIQKNQKNRNSSSTSTIEEPIDYLSVLKKKTVKESSKSESPALDNSVGKSEDVPFFRSILKKTENFASLLSSQDSCRTSQSPVFQENDLHFQTAPVSSDSKSLPPSKQLQCNDEATSISASSSRRSSASATSDNCNSISDSINESISIQFLRRRFSSEGHSGQDKRKAMIRSSEFSSILDEFVRSSGVRRDDGDDVEDDNNADSSYLLPVQHQNSGDDDDGHSSPDSFSFSRENNSKTSEIQTKVEMTVKEMYQTELNYVEKLKLINYEFKDELLNQKVINEQDASTMFMNISEILKFHLEQMLPELEKSCLSSECSLGKTFNKLGSRLIMYSDYMAGFTSAIQAISQKCKKHPKFHECLTSIQARPSCGNLTLQNHMLNPVQQIPRYILLLKQYIKYLPSNSPDLKEANLALKCLSNVAEYNNTAVKNNKNGFSLLGSFLKPQLLCSKCGRDVTNKHVHCSECQKFYCKQCFQIKQLNGTSVKLRLCSSCREIKKQVSNDLRVEGSLKLIEGILEKKNSKGEWVETWFAINSAGKLCLMSDDGNEFENVVVISLDEMKLKLPNNNSNKQTDSYLFTLSQKNKKSMRFRAPDKEQFDKFTEGLRAVLNEKQNLSLSCSSPSVVEKKSINIIEEASESES